MRTLVAFISLNSVLILGFNFDLENPLIIKNSYQSKSQFGASVSLVTDKDTSSSWLIVGAPRGNSSLPKQYSIHEPGVIWRCSLGKSSDSCEVLVMDESGNELQPYHNTADVYNRKDGGRLGEVSFIGDSDRFVACAPKWSNQRAALNTPGRNQSHYYMNGLCYWRPKSHIVQNDIPSPLLNHTLIPLRDKDRQASKDNSTDFEWIFGESGFSIHITDKNEMILGAPGVSDWMGTVIRLSDRSGESVSLERNGLKKEYGSMFHASPNIIRPEDKNLRTKNTYFGFAVSAGHYFQSNNNATQFAAGAPRSSIKGNLTGHVTIFRFPEGNDDQISEIQTLDGPGGTGSYFGSVLCSVDLNKDGYADLLVGAPRYNSRVRAQQPQQLQRFEEFVPVTKAGLTGFQDKSNFIGNGDEGVVFVYLSNGKQMLDPVRISGSNKPWSNFGSAISSLGDINNDGYNDVAIGAPREDSNRGAVYIFNGGPNGLSTKYSQVIYAKELDLGLLGFGNSISLGLDIDKNSYNDLAIGAYSSSHVVVLRTRPVVTIFGSITSPISNINLTAEEFNFMSCVTYKGYEAPPTLNIRVHLSSDTDTKLGRVHIKIPDTSKESNQTYIYVVNAQLNLETCTSYEAVVRRPLTLSQGPVVIRQEVFLEDETSSKPKTKTTYDIQPSGFGSGSPPRLVKSGPRFDSFCKTCARRNLNQPNYVSLSLPLAVECGDDKICRARLKVEASFQGISDDTFIMGTAKAVGLLIVVSNLEETAISPGVTVSWTKRNLVEIPPNCDFVTPTNLSCTLGDILRSDKGETRNLILQFEMSDLIAGHQNTPDEFVLTIQGTTVSHQAEIARVDKMLFIKAQADIFVSGEPELVYFYETNPAQILEHKYNISLEGPSTLSNIELVFEIPFRIDTHSEGPPFVNITNILVQYDGDLPYNALFNGVSIFSPESYMLHHASDPDLDDLDLDMGFSDTELVGKDLKKREISDEVPIETKKLPSKSKSLTVKDKVIQIDCSSNSVQCARVTCLIHEFKPNTLSTAKISMKVATQDLRNLMKQYNAHGVQIRSQGRALVNKKFQPFPHQPDSYDCSTTISTTAGKTPEWVIPASVFGGLLILACITLCLWAMGVFDRKKPTEVAEVMKPEERAEMKPLNAQSIDEEDEVFTRD